MALALSAIENLICRDAQLEALGEWHVREMSIAKYYASEILQEITTRAIGVHGGCGCSRGYEVERCRREAVVLPLFGGTSEIQWFIIARELVLTVQGRARADYRARDLAQLAELEARARASGGAFLDRVARTRAACERLWELAARTAALRDGERAPHERPLAELATSLAVAIPLLLQASSPDADELERELSPVAVAALEDRAAAADGVSQLALTRALRARL